MFDIIGKAAGIILNGYEAIPQSKSVFARKTLHKLNDFIVNEEPIIHFA